MVHETMEKFGFPGTLIKEYRHWVVQYRPKQTTLGALVLICKEDVKAFSSVSKEAFAELQLATDDIETALGDLFGFNKINYLMLMMVDPHVHFHVIPRYSEDKEFEGQNFSDPGWPAVPNLGHNNEISEDVREKLIVQLRLAMARE